MPNKKTRKSNSGFDYDVVGTLAPKGTTFKKNRDGTITPVYPKKKKETKKK